MQTQNRNEVIGTVAAYPRENVIFYAQILYTRRTSDYISDEKNEIT